MSKSTDKKLRILWGSEQPTRPTGYGTVTREICKRLVERGHEVFIMGWDYNGEDFKHEEGWTMVHAGISGYGAERLSGDQSPTVLEYHLMRLKPDLYFTLNDPFYIGSSVVSTNRMEIPYVAYMPIDGYPISYAWKDVLKMLHTPLWMSNFGKEVFSDFIDDYHSGGNASKTLREPLLDRYRGKGGEVLLHGVDTLVFAPISEEQKQVIKEKFGIPHWKFIFSSVGRNTNRKQIPRLLQAFRNLLDEADDPNSIGLLIHCGDATDTMGMGGWDLPLTLRQMDLLDNVRFTDKGNNPLMGLSREELAMVYAVSDVHVLATGGEGFGVPSAEAMSTGIPIILPDNSTGSELTGGKLADGQEVVEADRGWLVKCVTSICGGKWSVNMGLVDIEALQLAMQSAIDNPEIVEELGRNARDFAVENLDWEVIVDQAERILRKAATTKHPLGRHATLGM
jgi:glycosyltransferase involved in cell wall biosynthesis